MGKTLVGTVSSVAPNKTIVIAVSTRKTHPIYKKQYKVTTKFMAHDEENSCKVGDLVSIVETRPISARKRFKLEKILEHARLSKDDLKVMNTDEPEKKADKPSEKVEKKDSTEKTEDKADKKASSDKEKGK